MEVKLKQNIIETSINSTINKIYHKNIEASIINADCFHWLESVDDNSIDAIVTDPPYGIKEFDIDQIRKKNNGKGGIWRLPPSFDGAKRSPLPRFTALTSKERDRLKVFFTSFGEIIGRKLKPGAHVFLASNTFLSQFVFNSIVNENLEFRGEIIRLVRTMRGGDKPKLYEEKFADICTMPRACFEPWGLFRKKIPKGMKVGECLEKYGTGGLRRISDQTPFEDVIESRRTSKLEREISDHPSLKPQKFLRKIVYASLPLGQGVVIDPFMGSGSTIAASLNLGYDAIGIERHKEYYKKSIRNIPKLIEVE